MVEGAGADGRLKATVTVLARPDVPDTDYVKNSFFEHANTRRVYRFDSQTERLEAVQVYLQRDGTEVQIFELSQIDYDQPLAPEIWQLALPADVNWYQAPQRLPDNEKYTSMTAEQAARAFFEACGREDWAEAGKFMSPLPKQIKDYLGGIEIVNLGAAFTSKAYGGRFVPYEIRLRSQQLHLRLSNENPAKRFVVTGVLDGGLQLREDIKWSTPPTVLPDNSAYAALSAAEAAKAYCGAIARFDWAEIQKFLPESEVARMKQQVAEVQKQGIDPRNLLPQLEAGEAVASADPAYSLVKCRLNSIKRTQSGCAQGQPGQALASGWGHLSLLNQPAEDRAAVALMRARGGSRFMD